MGSFFSLVSLALISAAGLTMASSCFNNRLPIVRFASTSALLTVKKRRDDSTETNSEQQSLRTLIKARCPSLFTEFHPIWWLPNGHLQTMYTTVGDFTKIDIVSYQRKYIRLLDGATLGLDFCPLDSEDLPDNLPIVVVQHGLLGGSSEPYVRAVVHRACAPVEKGGLGYRAVVINFRGCARTPVTSAQFYSAGHTDDFRQALMYISHLYPKAPLVGVGFSLGANVMIRYLAEEGTASRLLAGCVIGCPWDLLKNVSRLNDNFLTRQLYSKTLGSHLVRTLKRHAKVLGADPEHPVAKATNLTLGLKTPTIVDFDNTFTRIAGGPAPNFPFETAQDYYRWSSSHKLLPDICVPLLALNAADDPLVFYTPDVAGNPYVVMGLTSGGGHLGWFQAGAGGSIERWTTKPILEWLELMAAVVVYDTQPRLANLYLDDKGFLKEEGRDDLGCKEIEIM